MQRDLMAALRAPLDGADRAATLLTPRAVGETGHVRRTAEAYIAPSDGMEPSERLGIYRRQYWFRVLDSIAEDFPRLRRLLGEERFWTLAEGYLAIEPSRSFTLRHLGRGLAGFIRRRRHLVGPMAVQASEVATLEYAACEAFGAAELPSVDPARIAEVPLRLQPHLRLFALRSPADLLWAADDGVPLAVCQAPPMAAAIHVAVFREAVGTRIRVERLAPGAFLLLGAIGATGSLADALAATMANRSGERGVRAGDIREWCRVWTERRWLCARATARGRG